MEMLKYQRTDHLLDASLDSLHAQSVEWLHELAFWSDEISFLYQLLHHRKIAKAFPSSEVAAIDQELVKLNGEKLDPVKAGVASHERQLAAVYRSQSLIDEQVYRETHRKLLQDILHLAPEIRAFKKKVFSFIENI